MSKLKFTKLELANNRNSLTKNINTKLLKANTINKENPIKSTDQYGPNAVLKFAKFTGNSNMQTRNGQLSKEKEEIDTRLSSNLNQSSNNRTIETTKIHRPLNKTNIVLTNGFNLFNSTMKSNTIAESPVSLNCVHQSFPIKADKSLCLKQTYFKPKGDTFHINKKLNEFLKKDSDDKIYSLFSFPEIGFNKRNAQIPYEYFNDFLETFCNEEKCLQFKIVPNFINDQMEVNNRMRAIVVNWLIEVHNRFKLLPDTLFLSVLLFDRYMSLVKSLEKKRLQLIGVTSLLLACKYEEIFSPEIRDFVCILDQTYDRDDLMNQENEMMKKLKFEVAFPSSLKYYEILRIELDIKESYYDYGCYLLELSLLDSRFSKYSQALIATTVCFMVLKFQGEIPKLFFEKIQIPFDDVKSCLIDICFLIDNIESSIFTAIVKKFKEIPHIIKKKCTQGFTITNNE